MDVNGSKKGVDPLHSSTKPWFLVGVLRLGTDDLSPLETDGRATDSHSAASRDRRPWSNGAKEAIPLTASALTEGHRSSNRPRRYIMCLVSPRRPVSGTAQITNG